MVAFLSALWAAVWLLFGAGAWGAYQDQSREMAATDAEAVKSHRLPLPLPVAVALPRAATLTLTPFGVMSPMVNQLSNWSTQAVASGSRIQMTGPSDVVRTAMTRIAHVVTIETFELTVQVDDESPHPLWQVTLQTSLQPIPLNQEQFAALQASVPSARPTQPSRVIPMQPAAAFFAPPVAPSPDLPQGGPIAPMRVWGILNASNGGQGDTGANAVAMIKGGGALFRIQAGDRLGPRGIAVAVITEGQVSLADGRLIPWR